MQEVENHQNNQTIEKSKQVWTQEKLAKLLGYEDVQKTELASEITESEPINNSEAHQENVVSQAELFGDDPRQNKTKHNFANNPFSKFGAVGLGMFLLFGLVAVILNVMTSGGPEVAPSIYTSASPKPEVKNTPSTEDLEAGKLKASLAIASQVEKIKAVENAKKNQPEFTVSKQKTPPKAKTEIPQVKPSPIQHVVKSYRPPQTVLPPVVSHHELPKLTPQEPIKSEKELDPMEELLTLNRLGSYGSQPIKQESTQEQASRATKQNIQTIPTTNRRQSLISSNIPSGFSTTSTEILSSSEEKIINGTSGQYLETDKTPNLLVGNKTKGKLLAPLIQSKKMAWNQKTMTPTKGSNGENEEKFIVLLTEPLKNNNRIILPKNTEIIAQANIQDSGLVQLQVTGIVSNNQEYPIPPGALAIYSKKGNPLIASTLDDNKHGHSTTKKLMNLFAGSLSNSFRSENNILNNTLESGLSSISQQTLRSNNRRLQNIPSSTKLWIVKAGTKVQIIVQQPFYLNMNNEQSKSKANKLNLQR